MALSFKHKGLEELSRGRKTKHVAPALHKKAKRILNAMLDAERPSDLAYPGWRLHPYPNRADTWSLDVSGAWRITFKFIEPDFLEIDLTQPH